MSETYKPKFFRPDGSSIDNIIDFIKYYEDRYYTYPKGDEFKVQYLVNGKTRSVGKCSRRVENKIENLLQKKKYTDSDIILILAWKIGKITHSKSDGTIVLHKDWEAQLGEWKEYGFSKLEEDGKCDLTRYKDIVIHISDIKEYLNRDLGKLDEKENITNALTEMLKQKWTGIGPVYKITLLYFKSNGKCPIYDQFAWRALNAIKNGCKPQLAIDAPVVTDTNAKELLSEYIDMVKEIEKFRKKEKDNTISNENKIVDRSLDRALWVYGHLFKSTGTGNDCK